MAVSTTNKTAGEDNIAADMQVTFIGDDGGRITTREEILIDGAGAQTVSGNQALCPFPGTSNPFYPPFCNIVQSGSNTDISAGSISTSARIRFIAGSANTPVTETYRINVQGVTESLGYTDARGTVIAYIKAHLQEGIEQQVPRRFATDPLGFNPVKAEDLSYSDTSTVTGLIQRYNWDMHYLSEV